MVRTGEACVSQVSKRHFMSDKYFLELVVIQWSQYKVGEGGQCCYWKVSTHHILETLVSTDKPLGHTCFMEEVFRFLSHTHIWRFT